MPDAPGAVADSPQPDAVTASSAEPTSPPQTPETAPPPTSQSEPGKSFNLPPEERWNQLRADRQEAITRAERAEAMARMAMEKFQSPQAPVAPEVDPYAGMEPQTAEFYRHLDKRIEQKASQLADQRMQGVLQAVNAGRQELASIKVAQFRKENPDITPGSPEEAAIASAVQQGYDLDTAKKLALYDKLDAENRALKSKQALTGSKAAANQTAPTSGIPSTAGLPGKPGDWRDGVRNAIRRGGSLADIVNAAGATRAPEEPT